MIVSCVGNNESAIVVFVADKSINGMLKSTAAELLFACRSLFAESQTEILNDLNFFADKHISFFLSFFFIPKFFAVNRNDDFYHFVVVIFAGCRNE